MGLSRCKASRFRIISTSGLRRLLVRLGSYGSVASDSLIALEGLLVGSVFTDRDLLRPRMGRMTPACSYMANGGCEWGRGGDRLRYVFDGGGVAGGVVAADDDVVADADAAADDDASCKCTC